LRNIVENALRHTPLGTTVSIVVAADPPSLKVIDHGPGVRPDHRNEIFRRFWQGGRDQNGGAGLGLDIAARTVVAHGGAISVSDAPEGGAIFTMEFQSIAGGLPEVNLPFRELRSAPQPLQGL
jgi:signal transduction histidine kinase